MQHLRTLFSLIATNSEVRKLLSDFSLIGRDLLARSAAHAAESVRPHPDALAGVDRPAPNDQFQTAGGRQAGPDETPVLEANVPGTDTTLRHHPKQGTEVEQDGEVRDPSDVADDARAQASQAKERAKETATDTAGDFGE